MISWSVTVILSFFYTLDYEHRVMSAKTEAVFYYNIASQVNCASCGQVEIALRRELIKDLETDYYERFEFDDLQKMVLEDRRLRINYWVSKITHKPIEKFKNPNLLN